MAKIIEITNPLTGHPQQAIQSDYTAQQIDDAVAAVQTILPSGPGLPVNQGGTGANTPQLALANLGARPNRNWMPNAYLMGGGTPGKLPINQAGLLSGNTDWEYMFDCWKQFGGNWSLTEDGLSMSLKDEQAYWSALNCSYVDVNQLIGKQFTLSFYVDNDIYSDTQTLAAGTIGFNGFPGSDRCEVTIDQGQNSLVVQYYGSPTSRVIHAAKLEEGDHQTLGWKDNAGTVHLFEVPPYLSTLLECQQYFFPLRGGIANISGVTNFGSGENTVTTPVPMAKTPVLQFYNNQKGVVYGPSGAFSVTDASVVRSDGNAVDVAVKSESNDAFNCVWREMAFDLVARP